MAKESKWEKDVIAYYFLEREILFDLYHIIWLILIFDHLVNQ